MQHGKRRPVVAVTRQQSNKDVHNTNVIRIFVPVNASANGLATRTKEDRLPQSDGEDEDMGLQGISRTLALKRERLRGASEPAAGNCEHGQKHLISKTKTSV